MRMKWDEEKTVTENLTRRLPRMTSRYFGLGDKALNAKASWEEMHDFRLASKRMRYTLELFRDVYGPSLEPFLQELRSLQNRLGDVNDAITTRDMIKGVPDSEAARKKLARRAKSKRKQLNAFWAEKFQGQAKRWDWYFKYGLIE